METNNRCQPPVSELFARNLCADLKIILEKLLKDQLDQFEVLSLADRFSVNLNEVENFSNQKYALQKGVLEQILRVEDEDRDYYKRVLEETEQNLVKKVSRKYSCSLIGCLFQSDKHRNYLKHLKKVHSTHNSLVCNFMQQCSRQFTVLNLLEEHVREVHSRAAVHGDDREAVAGLVLDTHCRCDMVRCDGEKFSSIGSLMTHVNAFHLNENRTYIFRDCEVKIKKGAISHRHFRLKHKNLNKMTLKAKHYINPPETAPLVSDNLEVLEVEENLTEVQDLYTQDDFTGLDDVDEDEDETCDVEDDDNFFLMQYADFYNRLAHVKYIPHRTIQDISNEFLQHALRSSEVREKKLRESLLKVPNIPLEEVDRIVGEVIGQDEMLKAQKELNSQHKRNKFISTHFKFVAPVEITMNKEQVEEGFAKEVVHYVPIKESFKHLIQDKSFLSVIENARNERKRNKGVLSDIMDGLAFLENSYFRDNPGAYAGHFYSDGVEVTNPLGAAKGKHKITQIFYSLLQIPREQRSQVDRMQLVMIYKDKMVKKHGLKKLLKPLISDLKDLEAGIFVDYPVRRMAQLGVLAYSGDNLESHQIGGFSMCFSSKDICRMCHCQHKDLAERMHDLEGDSKHKYWNKREYDQICDKLEVDDVEDSNEQMEVQSIEEMEVQEPLVDTNLLVDELENNDLLYEPTCTNISDDDEETSSEEEEEEDDQDDLATFGLRNRSPLNQLKTFHACVNLPPDLMHDVLEGVVAQDLYGFIKVFVQNGVFSTEEYNRRLKRFGFLSYEAADRPQDVPIKSKALKLPGKACSLWVHIRNFPLIIQEFFEEDSEDDVLLLALKLVDITNRLTAVEFRNHEIEELEDRIIDYLDTRRTIFESYPNLMGSVKPKHHFLVHYGQAIS